MTQPAMLTAEISMYPLKADYRDAIYAFIAALKIDPELDVRTNETSTQIFGPRVLVWQALQQATELSWQQHGMVVFAVKLIGADRR
jgi:hypothetical protein